MQQEICAPTARVDARLGDPAWRLPRPGRVRILASRAALPTPVTIIVSRGNNSVMETVPMNAKKRSEACRRVLETCCRKKVRFVRLWFTDLLGFLKSFAITRDELAKAMAEGMGFDGSSIEGYARIDESDMLALPDPTTFQIMPWGAHGHVVGRMFCDIVTPDGEPYAGCPRWCLKRALERARKMGFDTMNVGPELEYFYFRAEGGTEALDAGGYFDLVPRDVASDLRLTTVSILQDIGVPVEYAHHEVAASQHEIDLRYDEALAMADAVITYRLVVKEVAQTEGVYATFMPKPRYGHAGSGMHVHMSLFRKGRNTFYDRRAEHHLSDVALKYTAGLMKHAKEIIGVCAQWVNSYKRLVPGYEAPVYITWARKNRSSMIRVPMYKPGKEKATRIEFRAPDPACNPYLAFAVMLHAGLEGIEQGYAVPKPVERDVFAMTESERRKARIDNLPGSLQEALGHIETSKLVRKALGDHIFEKFVANKRIEWDRYRQQVHDYELQSYLNVL